MSNRSVAFLTETEKFLSNWVQLGHDTCHRTHDYDAGKQKLFIPGSVNQINIQENVIRTVKRGKKVVLLSNAEEMEASSNVASGKTVLLLPNWQQFLICNY